MKALVSLCLALCTSLSARADIYVVAAQNHPLRSLSAKELQSFYMGRSRALPSGDMVMVLDLPRSDAVRDAFYLALTGMGAAQINSYWSRLIFTGQVLPPTALPNEAAVLEALKRQPNSIGYLGQEPSDPAVRTLLVLKPPTSN